MAERRLPGVLVVDDNDANRYAVGRMLRAAGFEISEATDGRHALQLARLHPDVIVLDVNLPDMHGFDVVRALRSDPETAAIPILHLSASYMGAQDRVFGLENGANAYLTHPIEPPVLVATVRSLLRMRQAEEQREEAASEWQATFDAIGEIVCVLDATGAVRRANRAAISALGKTADDVIGKHWLTLMCRAFPGLDDAPLATAIERRDAIAHEAPASGRWLRVALDPLSARSGYGGSMVCVVSDITERKQAETERSALLAETVRAQADATSANRAKTDFLATMSHEIRTPINAILGYAQILDMGLAGPVSAGQRAQLDRLRRSAAHLLQLVNEVFDLTAVEAGHLRVDQERLPVEDAIEDALAIGRPLALARGITIDSDPCEERPLRYVGDNGRVRQILINLLSNAVKFSQPGSRITVDCEIAAPPAGTALDSTRSYVAIHVRDTGVGIGGAQLGEIFEPFVQGERGPTRTRGGSGLGLTISRGLARLMGGDITVTSVVNAGSAFTLWLPAADEQSFVPTREHPAEPRNAPFDPTNFAQLGQILVTEAFSVAHAMALRLRTDDRFPSLGALSDAQLIDHVPSYLSDVGLALMIISEVGVEASTLLHDGGAIRARIAERHGAQRHRIGWTADQVATEYDLLLEEIERAWRARTGVSGAELTGALELIGRLLDQSRVTGLRAFREASGETA